MSNASFKSALPAKVFIVIVCIIGVIFAYLSSAYVASLFTGLGYVLVKGTNAGLEDWLTTTTAAQFIYTVITYSTMIGLVTFIFKRFGVTWQSIQLGKPRFKDALWAVGFLPLYYSAYLIIIGIATKLFPNFNTDQQQQIGFSNAQGGELALVFLSLVVIPPIIEEIIMRGYLYTGLKRGMKLWLAAATTSLVFAMGHLEFGGGGPLVYVAAVFTFVLSVFLIVLREKTGRLWASIFLHALVNGLSFIALFVFGSR